MDFRVLPVVLVWSFMGLLTSSGAMAIDSRCHLAMNAGLYSTRVDRGVELRFRLGQLAHAEPQEILNEIERVIGHWGAIQNSPQMIEEYYKRFSLTLAYLQVITHNHNLKVLKKVERINQIESTIRSLDDEIGILSMQNEVESEGRDFNISQLRLRIATLQKEMNDLEAISSFGWSARSLIQEYQSGKLLASPDLIRTWKKMLSARKSLLDLNSDTQIVDIHADRILGFAIARLGDLATRSRWQKELDRRPWLDLGEEW